MRRTRLDTLRSVLRSVVVDLEAGHDPQMVLIRAELALHLDDQRALEDDVP